MFGHKFHFKRGVAAKIVYRREPHYSIYRLQEAIAFADACIYPLHFSTPGGTNWVGLVEYQGISA